MANCLYLDASYITKFDFMNYVFAEKFVKTRIWWKILIYWMDICCRCTLNLPTMYVNEIKETYFEI